MAASCTWAERWACFGILSIALHLPAAAGVVYRLDGTRCLDSNRGEVLYPVPNLPPVFGPGPTLCADTIFAELHVGDGFTPGATFVYYNGQGWQPTPFASMSVDDGARAASTSFTQSQGLSVSGLLPLASGLGDLAVHWVDGWSFRARANGTWTFGIEFGARDGGCGLGSVEGPLGLCTPTGGHYVSHGTYTQFLVVPEPQSLVLSLLALASLALVRRRKARRLSP